MFERILRKLKQELRHKLGALVLTAFAVLAALGGWWYLSPTQMTIAVGPWGSAEGKLVGAYAEALAEQDKDVRLKVVPYGDVRQSAQALQDKKVDLAIVRPDVLLPNNGLTVAILREEAVIVVAPGGDIKNVAGLTRKRLAVITHHAADLPAIRTVLAHYKLDPSITLLPMPAENLEAALKEAGLDAVAFVAAPASLEASKLVQLVAQAAGNSPAPKSASDNAARGEDKNEHLDGEVTVVPIDDSEALALKSPTLTTLKIPPGTLSGSPKLPQAEITTVAVSYRLMARSNLDRGPLSKLTQYLFQMRSRIAQTEPSVNLLIAPDDDTATSAALPNHPGAFDYYKREQLSFMDRYGDWVWIALLCGGSLTSAMAWVGQLFIRKRRELIDEILDRLMCMLSEAREARSVSELDALALEIDSLVTHGVRYSRFRTTSGRTMSALILSIESARAAIMDRRREMFDRVEGRPESPARKTAPASEFPAA